MAAPSDDLFAWASNANYSTGSKVGQPTKDTPDPSEIADGFLPNTLARPEVNNAPLDNFSRWIAHALDFASTLLGDGSDGDVTISSNTALTEDLHCTSLTVESGFTLDTDRFRILCTGTVTVQGTIRVQPGASGTLQSGQPTVAATTGAGNDGVGTDAVGGDSGAGGDGSSGNGGSAATADSPKIGRFPELAFVAKVDPSGWTGLYGGASGASGGGNGSDVGGASGSGAGLVYIACETIAWDGGDIEAEGEDGGNPGTSNCGGGGGGGGGVIVLVRRRETGSASTSVAGGAAGAGVGTGTNGGAGSDGQVVRVDI